jgi:hypothetical protein
MVSSVNERAPGAAFRDLRRLADWFADAPPRAALTSLSIDRLLSRLGATAVPLLGRELCSAEPARREAARDALAAVAGHGAHARTRVAAELRAITGGPAADEAKVVALGLLSELGEHADARFADPAAIRVRSAIALAAQLETAADLAGAADMMVRELCAIDIVQMLEVMAEAAPDGARRLATELALRLDLAIETRDRIALVIATLAASPARRGSTPARRPHSRVRADVLVDGPRGVDAAARVVVIASCRSAGGRRWRRWAVLIGPTGQIDDCLHEDACVDGSEPLIDALCAEGYRMAPSDRDHARDAVVAAARRTVEAMQALPSPYYLGRDLLDLADAHMDSRHCADPSCAALARAIELVAAGDHARARPLLDHCDLDHPDAAAALAACLFAEHRPDAALAALDRAVAAEPAWPLHHWNRAAALHLLGDPRGCYDALRRFTTTSTAPTGLHGDPDQPARLVRAQQMIAELERTARLTGVSLHRRGRRGASKTVKRRRGVAAT